MIGEPVAKSFPKSNFRLVFIDFYCGQNRGIIINKPLKVTKDTYRLQAQPPELAAGFAGGVPGGAYCVICCFPMAMDPMISRQMIRLCV